MNQSVNLNELSRLKVSLDTSKVQSVEQIDRMLSQLHSELRQMKRAYPEPYVRQSLDCLEHHLIRLDRSKRIYENELRVKIQSLSTAESMYRSKERSMSHQFDKGNVTFVNALKTLMGVAIGAVEKKIEETQKLVDDYDIEISEAEMVYFAGLPLVDQKVIAGYKQRIADESNSELRAEYENEVYSLYRQHFSQESLADLYGHQRVEDESMIQGSVSGDLLTGELSTDVSASFKLGDDKMELGAEASVTASGALATASTEAQIGFVSGSANVVVGGLSGEASAGMTVIENGRFDPKVGLSAKAEAVGLQGDAGLQVGSDAYNIHGDATGYVGHASAEASAAVGLDGIEAGFDVGAAVFEGEATAGFTIFGVDVEATIEGEAISIGAEGEIGVTDDEIEIGAKLSALLGLGIELRIKW